MKIRTQTVLDRDAEPVKVVAVIIEGGAGRKEIPVGPADDVWSLHADVARELADRPIRLVSATKGMGCVFDTTAGIR